VRRPLPYLVALILGVAAAVAVGCGDRSNLIPSSDAAALKAQLSQIKADVDAGNCTGLDGKLQQVHDDATNLPGKIDRGLRSRINDGVQALQQTAPDDCATAAESTQTETQPPPTQTETVPTTTTETQTETQTTPTVPTDTTTSPVPTTSTPAPSDATPPATPDPGTGTPAPPDTGGTPGADGAPTP
jgi:hypothetical protein